MGDQPPKPTAASRRILFERMMEAGWITSYNIGGSEYQLSPTDKGIAALTTLDEIFRSLGGPLSEDEVLNLYCIALQGRGPKGLGGIGNN